MPIPERLYRAYQQDLITLLALDDEHGKIVANVDPKYFDADYQVVAIRCQDYWKQYGKAPGEGHIADLVADIVEDEGNRQRMGVNRVLEGMLFLQPKINVEYVLKMLRDFIRLQTQKDTLLRAAELLNAPNEETSDQVDELLGGMLRPHENTTFDAGVALGDLDYWEAQRERHEYDEFVTGIAVLDRRQVVPARGTLNILLGVTSHGKSWWLINLGKHALMHRKKVLHVTLELSAAEVQNRYLQNFFAVAGFEHQKQAKVRRLRVDDNTLRLLGLELDEVEADYSMQAPNVERLRKLIAYGSGMFDDLRIRKFPMGSLTVAGLRRYLSGLEAIGFMPDLLIVDYAGVMQTDADNLRITLGRVVQELKGLADERHIAVVTAQQVNKEGAKAKRVEMTHVAEDWSINHTADIVMSLTRTDEEERHGLARLYVHKHRSGEQGFGAVLSQNYAHGQFWMDSGKLVTEEYEQMLERLA